MLVLASASPVRRALLENAGVDIDVVPVKIDERTIRESLIGEQTSPRDIADTLAEMKAARVRRAGLILGCDQVLEHDGRVLSKPIDPADAVSQLISMSGGTHVLHSAAVLSEDGRPVWRVVTSVKMNMKYISKTYAKDYLARNWHDIRYSAGSYTFEGEGARLFRSTDGDYFSILGLPLLPLLDFLTTRGELAL